MVTALEQSRLLAEEARGIDFLPIQVRALGLLATMYTDGGEPRETEALLQEIIEKAARAKADEPLAEAWIALIRNVGMDQAEPDRALALRRPAEAAIVRAGDAESLHASLRHTLAMILRQQGKEAEAYEHNEFVLEVWERTLGPEHPSVGTALNNLGGSLLALKRPDEALAHFERALEVWERALGPAHPDVAIGLTNVAMIHVERGEHDLAEPLLLRALAIKEAAYGPDHPTLGATLNTLGIVAGDRGEVDQALAYQRRALAISERELGPGHPRLGIAKFNAGSLLVEKERFSDARPLLDGARQIFVGAFGAEHTYVGYVDVALARCDVGDGEAPRALERLAPVLRRLTGPDADPVDLAEARYAEAQARDALGQRAQALRLARQAATAYAAAGAGSAPELRKVHAWLARRQ